MGKSGYEQILRRVHSMHSNPKCSDQFLECDWKICRDLHSIVQSQVRYGLKSGDHWLIDQQHRRSAFESEVVAQAYVDVVFAGVEHNVEIVAYHLAPDGGVI